MDFAFVVVLEFVFDGEAVWLFESGDDVEEVALESCEVVHMEIRLLGFERSCSGVSPR